MGIYALVYYLFQIYSIAIIVYIFMSWLPGIQASKFGVLLGKIVEPYLSIFRKIIPTIGMIDISPIVALFALNLIQRGVYTVLEYLL